MKRGLTSIPKKRTHRNVFGSDNEEEEQPQQTITAIPRTQVSVKEAPIAAVLDYDSFFEAKKQQEIQQKKLLDADKRKVR